MIEDADIHERQGIFQLLRDAQIRLARFGDAAWVLGCIRVCHLR